MYIQPRQYPSPTAFDDEEIISTAIGFGKAISVLLLRIQTVNELRRQRELYGKTINGGSPNRPSESQSLL